MDSSEGYLQVTVRTLSENKVSESGDTSVSISKILHSKCTLLFKVGRVGRRDRHREIDWRNQVRARKE